MTPLKQLRLEETYERGVFRDENGNVLTLAEGQMPEHTGGLVAVVSLELRETESGS